MSRSLFIFLLTVSTIAILLFFPFLLETDIYYDMNRKKLGFALFLFKFIKLTGGYISTYANGIAWHISRKKAVLVPYARLDSERKRFSFMKTFRLLSLRVTTETGAEYMLFTGIAHTVLRVILAIKYPSLEDIETKFWLTDGDVFRVGVRSVVYFNIFLLLTVFVRYLTVKWRNLWKKEMKKSIN